VRGLLHASQTPGVVLQTALCYIEAVRGKVLKLMKQEDLGERASGETWSFDRIITAEQLPYAEAEAMGLSMPLESIINTDHEKLTNKRAPAPDLYSEPPGASPPTLSLPSRLLCPRRTFLAAIILASKFIQDQCYGNKRWAQLSGLHPLEIGRCERALGGAL